MIRIALNIEHLCAVKKIKKNALADMLEITPTSINAYTSGKNYPTLVNTVKMADIFGVSLDELVLTNLVEQRKQNYYRHTAIPTVITDDSIDIFEEIRNIKAFLLEQFGEEFKGWMDAHS